MAKKREKKGRRKMEKPPSMMKSLKDFHALLEMPTLRVPETFAV
jgi:hypothetical protein